MSSDSHRFWEDPTFQMCTFQLFLLSDRKGGDTIVLKKLEVLQTSCVSQFYVLHPIEWGTLFMLRTGYGPVHSDYLCISRSRKKWSQQRNSSRIQLRAMPAVMCSQGWGRVKEKLKKEAKHWISPVWQNSLKYTASFHMFMEIVDPVLSLQFDTTGNMLIYKMKGLVIFCWCLIYMYSVPPSCLPKIPSFVHISFLVAKGKE